MCASHFFAVETALRAPAERVWQHASTFAGVNRELWPVAQMTYPRTTARLVPGAVPLGRRAFRSWVLLFGLVPVDFDDFTLIELSPGRGFQEVSPLLSMWEWRHRRTITPAAWGCVVRDEVSCVPRWRWAAPFLVAVYHTAFRLRHRALQRYFGRAGVVRTVLQSDSALAGLQQ